MSARRSRRDEGAILILVLVIVTILGIAAASIAQLGYTTPQSQRVYAAQERLVNALDTATAAAIEDVRLGSAIACPADDLELENADGLADAAKAPMKVAVKCAAGAATQLKFTATGYMSQPSVSSGCGSTAVLSMSRKMETTVAFFAAPPATPIPGSAPSPTSVRVVSRDLTSTAACQDPP